MERVTYFAKVVREPPASRLRWLTEDTTAPWSGTMSGGPAKGRIVQASAEKIAEYTRPRPQSGRNRPRPPPFGTDDSRPEYPSHRGNSHGAQSGRPVTPQQA
eukprot:2983797-Prymnesium_polylepis.1